MDEEIYDGPPHPQTQPETWNKTNSGSVDFTSLLEDPDKSIIEIISLYDVQTPMKEHNAAFEKLITRPETICEMLEYIKEGENKIIIIKIIQLFYSPNQTLLEALIDSTDNIDIITSIILYRGDNYLYRIGVACQILSEALHHWSSSVFEIMSQSQFCFSAMLSSIQITSIYQTLKIFAKTPPEWFHTFIWGLLTAYISGRTSMPMAPNGWKVEAPGIINCGNVKLNTSQRVCVLKIIGSFLKKFHTESKFPNCMASVLSYIASTIHGIPEKEALLKTGLYLQSNKKLIELALDILDREQFNLPITQKAVAYLAKWYDGEKIEPILNFVFRVLNPEFPGKYDKNCKKNPNIFVLQETIKLTSNILERVNYPRFFSKAIQHCIAYSWNNKIEADSLVFRSILLQLSTIVEDTPSWNGWITFHRQIIEKFNQNLEFQTDRRINTAGMDEDLLEKLKTHSSVIEITETDRKPFFYDISLDDFSQARSGESGSYDSEYDEDSDIFGHAEQIVNSFFESNVTQSTKNVSVAIDPELETPIYENGFNERAQRSRSKSLSVEEPISPNGRTKKVPKMSLDTNDQKCTVF